MDVVNVLGELWEIEREDRQMLIERCLIDYDVLSDVAIHADIIQDCPQKLFLISVEFDSRNKFSELLDSFFPVDSNERTYECTNAGSASHNRSISVVVFLASEFLP